MRLAMVNSPAQGEGEDRMFARSRNGERSRWSWPFALLVAVLVAPATAQAKNITVGPGRIVTASAKQALASPTPSASTAAKPTPQEAYNPALAARTQKPIVLPAEMLAPPAFQAAFPGEDIATCCFRPPDTHGAVGKTQFVEVTNGEGVSVFRKSDGVKLKQTFFSTLWGYSTKTIFDPRVVYDKMWNRWVITAEAFNEDATIQRAFIAASTSSDATGSYCLYTYDVPEAAGSNDFYDYPQLGMDQDSVIITANIFDDPVSGPYLRTRMYAPPKAAIYNCRGFGVPYFNLGAVGTVAPPIVEDPNSNAYLVSFFNSTTLKLFRATNLGRSGAGVVFQANVAIPAVSSGPPMRQPGSGSLGPPTGRFQNASTQIGDALLNIHTIAAGSFPMGRWYQVDTEGVGANTVPAGRLGNVLESSTSDDSNPGIVGSALGGSSANPIGRMFVTWNATDALNAVVANRHQVRVKGSGRLAADAVSITGGLNFGQAVVAYNPTTDNPERWGDYSAVTIDPVAAIGCSVGNRAWLVNEQQTTATLWGSRLGALGYC